MDTRTKFRKLLDAIVEQLDHPRDPAALLAAHEELLKMGVHVPEIISARNELLRRQAEAARLAAEAAEKEAAERRLAEASAEITVDTMTSLVLLANDFLRRCELKPRREQTSCFGRLFWPIETKDLDEVAAGNELKQASGTKWCRVTVQDESHVLIEMIFNRPFETVEAEQATCRETFLRQVREECMNALDPILTALQKALAQENCAEAERLHGELSEARHSWALAQLYDGQEGRHEKLEEIAAYIATMKAEQQQFAMRAKLALLGPGASNGKGSLTLHRESREPLTAEEKSARAKRVLENRAKRLADAPKGVSGSKSAPGKGKKSKRAASDPHRNGK